MNDIKFKPLKLKLSFETRIRFDHSLRWVRSCQVCGNFFPPIDLLCGSCWGKLEYLRNRGEDLILKEAYPFPVYSLWTWTRQNNYLVRPLIQALKQGRASSVALNLAKTLAEERGLLASQVGLIEDPVFILPPRSNPEDHAWILAKAISDFWQRPLWDGLKLKELNLCAGPQKKRSAADRMRRCYETDPEAAEFPKGQTIVFIDDVITTGSTAMAAYMALEDPPHFEVWTLFHRLKMPKG